MRFFFFPRLGALSPACCKSWFSFLGVRTACNPSPSPCPSCQTQTARRATCTWEIHFCVFFCVWFSSSSCSLLKSRVVWPNSSAPGFLLHPQRGAPPVCCPPCEEHARPEQEKRCFCLRPFVPFASSSGVPPKERACTSCATLTSCVSKTSRPLLINLGMLLMTMALSVVRSATISLMPSLLTPPSLPSGNWFGGDPVCDHNNHLPVSDSLGWSSTISSVGGTCSAPPNSVSGPLPSTNAADLEQTNIVI